MRRAALLFALIPALAAAAGGTKPASYGEYVRAARAIEEWRYEEARKLLGELGKVAPSEPETHFLEGELLFLEGDYAGAKKILEAITDARMKEAVAELLPVVVSTHETLKGHLRKESASFVVLYPAGKDEVLVDVALATLEAARREIGADLGYLPPGKVRVEILGRVTDLARVSTLTEKEIETSGTIALCKYGKLMIVTPRATLFGYPWLDTLAHEYTHYVVSRKTGDRVPIWLHEGLAKFEESRWRAKPGEAGLSRVHQGLLSEAVKKGRLVTFDEMHPSMAKLPSQEAAATAFAEVQSLIAWIHGKVGYPGLRGVLERIADGRTERRAVGEVLGSSFVDVEAAWKKSLRAAAVPPAKGLRGGKIRWKKGKADDENQGLEDVPEDRARKHARLGGLLRTRGRLRAAAVEYAKALDLLPGEGSGRSFVASKLARTWLDLGENQKAVQVAEPLAARDDDDPAPHATLGAAYLAMGDPAKAEAQLVHALRISPFDPAVRCGLAEVYTQSNRPEAAREQAACRTLRESR